MMRSLVDGEGVGGVVRHIRAVREEVESAEDEARRTYAVSRFVLLVTYGRIKNAPTVLLTSTALSAPCSVSKGMRGQW